MAKIRLAGDHLATVRVYMRKSIVLVISAALFAVACEGGCDLGKLKDKAMQYKDKIPTDKIPTKMP